MVSVRVQCLTVIGVNSRGVWEALDEAIRACSSCSFKFAISLSSSFSILTSCKPFAAIAIAAVAVHWSLCKDYNLPASVDGAKKSRDGDNELPRFLNARPRIGQPGLIKL